jgi:UDP-glucose 4-epimerase
MDHKIKIATIIGSKGFIGSHLTRHLNINGWNVKEFNRDLKPSKRDNLNHVFYCAGLTNDFASRPFDTVEAHVSSLAFILENCHFESLTYLSSTRLYDGLGLSHVDEETSLQLDPRNPRHLYDLTKATGESLCRIVGQGKARIARLSCVWNAKDDEGFLPSLLRQSAASEGKTISIDSSPHFTRDYIHLDDVISGMIAIGTRGRAPLYNLSGGANVSNAELFEWVEKRFNVQIVPSHDHRPASSPIICNQLLSRELGCHPVPLLEKLTQLSARLSL